MTNAFIFTNQSEVDFGITLVCDGGSQSDSFRRFESTFCLHPQGQTVREDEDTMTLQNADNSPKDTESHSTRLTSAICVYVKRRKF